tara:strand:+ start:14154 stop:14717 length:564 start_codon:yes stop_codon:yes gene_type:complete
MSFMLLGILNSQAAGGGGGAFDLLETTTLTTTTSSVTFSSLGAYSDYKHLQIRSVARNTVTNSGSSSLNIRFNGDTSTSYKKHGLAGNGSAVYSYTEVADGKIVFESSVADNGTTSGIYAPSVIDILDFSASKNTTVRSMCGVAGIGNPTVQLQSGLYFKTAAVTSITLYGDWDFITGSRFSLYGVK